MILQWLDSETDQKRSDSIPLTSWKDCLIFEDDKGDERGWSFRMRMNRVLARVWRKKKPQCALVINKLHRHLDRFQWPGPYWLRDDSTFFSSQKFMKFVKAQRKIGTHSLGGGGGFRKGRKCSLPVSLLSDLIPPERRESQDPLETLSRASLMVLRRTFPFNGPSLRFV
jgi:hypothetical protein